ncbi:hypothetical protein [Streptomyces virginiae]|uniref:hypothetical protein n=1 Tax=Streptomyces virginiae TaxID=1961 RepID=UPI002256E69C|nr:hypothetical protein [Streptomyces virginiae]MCX5176699.1 hypothetical protein [Streptomyces virginiae]
MSTETWAQVGLTAAAAVASAFAGRAARRSRRQENRDDFVAVTEQQGKAIERLEKRVQQGETKAELQQEKLAENDEAIAWLLVRIRDLVGSIRKSGGEPPAARPMSARAARVLERSDV